MSADENAALSKDLRLLDIHDPFLAPDSQHRSGWCSRWWLLPSDFRSGLVVHRVDVVVERVLLVGGFCWVVSVDPFYGFAAPFQGQP